MHSHTYEYPARAVLTVDEFCATVTIGRTGFYDAVKLGLIRPLKFGTRTLVPASEVSAFLDRLSEPGR
jgi:excisionase family DNA binding protein